MPIPSVILYPVVTTLGLEDISSILANGFVEQLGKKNIYTLVGGIDKWILEGRKLKK